MLLCQLVVDQISVSSKFLCLLCQHTKLQLKQVQI
jgi:hypothetical protein